MTDDYAQQVYDAFYRGTELSHDAAIWLQDQKNAAMIASGLRQQGYSGDFQFHCENGYNEYVYVDDQRLIPFDHTAHISVDCHLAIIAPTIQNLIAYLAIKADSTLTLPAIARIAASPPQYLLASCGILDDMPQYLPACLAIQDERRYNFTAWCGIGEDFFDSVQAWMRLAGSPPQPLDATIAVQGTVKVTCDAVMLLIKDSTDEIRLSIARKYAQNVRQRDPNIPYNPWDSGRSKEGLR